MRLRTCLVLAALVTGCASRTPPPRTTAGDTARPPATTASPTAAVTAIAGTATTVADPGPGLTTDLPTTAVSDRATVPSPSEGSPIVPGPPSLPVWVPPSDAVALPAPEGELAVGVAATAVTDTVVYYPARAGSGRGPHRYLDPAWATAAGLDPAEMDRVVSSARVDAIPEATGSPRPIVLLAPGWRSVIALSTSLAEDLASHGFVVLATQTDVGAEWSHPRSTDGDRAKRLALLDQVLDYAVGPALPALVGPVDVHDVAVGGHSYAATVALDAALTDRRITATIDLDGSARGAATRTPPRQPTLILVTIDHGIVSDPVLGKLAVRSDSVVSVGLLDAEHVDVTDGPVIRALLGNSVFATLLGSIGPTGTTDTSAIVVRFVNAIAAHRPVTSEELVRNLPSTTPDPFRSQTPSG